MRPGQAQVVILRQVEGAEDDGEIRQAFIQLVQHVGRVTAAEMGLNKGIGTPHCRQRAGDKADGLAFAAADAHFAADRGVVHGGRGEGGRTPSSSCR